MEYFVTRDGRQEGPLSLDEINQRLSEGTLSPSDLGWTESMGDWKPLQDIPGVIVSIPGAPWGAEPAKPKGKGGLQTVLIILVVGLVIAGAVYGIMQLVGGESDTPPPADNNQTANNATDTNQTANNATQPPIVKIDPSPAGVITLTGHTNTITSLSFSPNGQFLVSGDAGGGLFVWNAESGAEIFNSGQKGAIKQVFFAGQNPAFFALSDQQMALWNVPQKKISSQAQKPPTGFSAAALNPRQPGNFFAIGAPDGRMEVWDTKGSKLYTQRGHTNAVTALTFAPNGEVIITGGQDRQVRVWQASNGKPLGTLSNHIGPIISIDIHASSLFTTASEDGAIIVWNGKTLTPIRRLTGHDGPVRVVAINPRNPQYIASGGQDRAFIYWDVSNQQKPIIGKLADHAGPVTAIAFAPNGGRMATGSADKSIKIRPLQ